MNLLTSTSIDKIFALCNGSEYQAIMLTRWDMTSIFISVIDPVFRTDIISKLQIEQKNKKFSRSDTKYQIAFVVFKYLTAECDQIRRAISEVVRKLFVIHRCTTSDIIELFKIISIHLLEWLQINKSVNYDRWQNKFNSVLEHVNTIIELSKTADSKQKTETIIDVSRYDAMHYKDDQKITALEFLAEAELELELLDDLIEYENDIKNLLYEDEKLMPNMLTLSSDMLTHYAKLLNQTIEFNDLAYCMETISQVLGKFDLNNLDTKQSKRLKIYIESIVSDLSDWREKMFLSKDALDIHYLDASMLSSCAQIEMLITPQEEEDEMELELF